MLVVLFWEEPVNKVLLLLISLLLVAGCTNTNYPYTPGTGYNDPYRYDDSYNYRDRDHYHDSYERRRAREERRRLEAERQRLEAERRRLEEARRKKKKHSKPHIKPKKETCPPGFRPSERKCTKKERKHGCKDIRLPGGLGCVNR